MEGEREEKLQNEKKRHSIVNDVGTCVEQKSIHSTHTSREECCARERENAG